MSGTSRSGPRPTAPGDARLLRRVRWKLVLWSGSITLAILVVLGTLVWVVVARSLASTATDQLAERAALIGRIVETGPISRETGSPIGRNIGLAFGGPGSGSLALLVEPDDDVIGPRELVGSGLPDQAGVTAARSSGTDVRETRLADLPVRILSRSFTRNRDVYVVQVIGDRTGEERTLNVLLAVLGAGGLAALFLALVGGGLYADRALVPIRDSLRRQREFAADASHELRTPLAVIRGSVEHLRRHPEAPVSTVGSALEDVNVEVDHLTRLVDDLLLLARADSGVVELQAVPVDLADVAASAVGGLANVAAARSIRLGLDAVPCMVAGDPGRLRQLVAILVDNAIKHSPDGGLVEVTVVQDRRHAWLRVDDQGPGVPEEHRAQVFERFWRAPDARPGGVGLGLSIAAWIVERHGGVIRVTTAPGGGARFEVRLPTSGPAIGAVAQATTPQT